MGTRKHIIYLTVLLLSSLAPPAWGQNLVVVDKANHRLVVVDRHSGDTLLACPVAIGINNGQKRVAGDLRTPEGIFPIVSIEKASRWTHDFGDGHGERKRAYGEWFIRLDVEGFTGIGLHGTCFPESIGTNDTEGCIRLLDKDLKQLVKLMNPGDLVVIVPDPTLPEQELLPAVPHTTTPPWRIKW